MKKKGDESAKIFGVFLYASVKVILFDRREDLEGLF